MNGNPVKTALEGEHWRGLTPTLLILLSATVTIATTLGTIVISDMTKTLHDVSEIVYSIDKRVVQIEANRFTAKDGTAIYQELNKKVDKAEVPPDWFRAQVDRNTTDIENLRAKKR